MSFLDFFAVLIQYGQRNGESAIISYTPLETIWAKSGFSLCRVLTAGRSGASFYFRPIAIFGQLQLRPSYIYLGFECPGTLLGGILFVLRWIPMYLC